MPFFSTKRCRSWHPKFAGRDTGRDEANCCSVALSKFSSSGLRGPMQVLKFFFLSIILFFGLLFLFICCFSLAVFCWLVLCCVFIFFGLFAYFMRGNLFLFHFSNQLNLITSFVFFFIRPLMAFQQMC